MSDNNDGSIPQGTESEIEVIHNFVQGLCSRPLIYTKTGTLAEFLTAMTAFEVGVKSCLREHPEIEYESSASATMTWLNKEFGGPFGVEDLVARFGSEEAAIAAIEAFAKTIPHRFP